jgi:hypothetical protein
MRATLSALIVAAGLAGFGAAAQAAPVTTANPLAITTEAPIVHVQMMRGERRMMRHRMMRRHVMHRRAMRHRMMHRRMHRM